MTEERGRGPIIESLSNSTVARLRQLNSRDGRRQQKAFLVEGVRLVAEAIAAGWPLLSVLYDEAKAKDDPELAAVVAHIRKAVPATEKVIRHACDTVTPQGIVAAAQLRDRPLTVPTSERLLLVLDGVSDPGNAGTLLRSALGAGVHTILATRGTVDLFSPKVVRGGMGAHFGLQISHNLTWPEIEEMMGRDRTVLVAEARSGLEYYRYDWSRPSVLVIGGEARGPSDDAVRGATTKVSIPLNDGVESLNAGVAGSIILFEAKRQLEEGS